MIFFGCVSNFIDKLYSDFSHISLTLLGVEDAKYFSVLAWTVGIFLEKALDFRHSLINAAARLYVSLHLLFLVLNRYSFSDNNFLLCLYDSQS
jgi:hypothetical protein